MLCRWYLQREQCPVVTWHVDPKEPCLTSWSLWLRCALENQEGFPLPFQQVMVTLVSKPCAKNVNPSSFLKFRLKHSFQINILYKDDLKYLSLSKVFPGGSVAKNLPARQETRVWSLGQEDPLEEEMATHSNSLAWRIPWTEKPGKLQPTELKRVGTWLSDLACMHN